MSLQEAMRTRLKQLSLFALLNVVVVADVVFGAGAAEQDAKLDEVS